ncbi:MAG: hypothetical protein B6245_13680 [Desulfobacteraceae bacterium 4572_88]|nr:MAG: hypothetical protein B6245_13680 [Desulfobacteraceae bacterium 4572_88]RLC06123.1 MAG: sigma-54-dependent Fis family transcriptional regulator [Deltaproteobacteria bacterium]
MKQSRYHISLYIIIPVIFSGFSILSSILTFRLTEYCIRYGLSTDKPILWTAIIIGVVVYVFSLLIVWIILRPMERFIKEARSLPALSESEPESEETKKRSMDKLEQFTQVFERVTSVLSRVDARQLFPKNIGESKAIRSVLGKILKVAPTDSTVLILGESGTGKELIASSIYEHSLRKGKPFIKLNCVAIPEGLWESELFGHEKGAFTGATSKKIGKLELANKGTFFLDEIGDMPLNTQAKLLRVLQEREFERVGGTEPIRIDVRFIAATNKNLEKMVREKAFREDLFYRLNVFSIRLPPLRERKEDIPLLVDYFIQQALKPVEISPIAMQLIVSHLWPGNVRELQNTIERATVMCENGMIEPSHLPRKMTGWFSNPNMPELAENASLDEKLQEIEKIIITDALQQADGVQVKAAKLLGIKVRSLWHRTKKLDIDVAGIKNRGKKSGADVAKIKKETES